MTSYVFVHGGGHGGWCWQPVASLLRAAGHDVYTPTLTGLGERSHLLGPGVDLDTHITDIVSVLGYEALTEVILVGHSYGGTVITGVADRAIDRVGHLVYLDAPRPRDGESLLDLAGTRMADLREAGRVVDGVELVLFPDTQPLGYYGIDDPAIIEWITPRLTPHPWVTFAQPLRIADQAGVDGIPRTNINCTPTIRARTGPAHDRALDADRVWEIDTGHDFMITEPGRVAEMLLTVATLDN